MRDEAPHPSSLILHPFKLEVAMSWIALRMLTGNRAKYFGIVFGLAFAVMLMSQQASVFLGAMRNTTSQIRDIQGADLWVMDPSVEFIDDVTPVVYRVDHDEPTLF